MGVRRLRTQLGLTQHAFAALVGVTRPMIVRWEAGRHAPLGARLARLRALETTNPDYQRLLKQRVETNGNIKQSGASPKRDMRPRLAPKVAKTA